MPAHQTAATAVLAALILLTGCGRDPAAGGATGDAQPAVIAANAKVAAELDLAAPQGFEDAARGFIARPSGKIMAADGTVAMDFDALAFVDGDAPPTVNPSLWRQARLNGHIGLFKVTEGIHQLRGFDISNMTLIDGASGWIVVDPLTSREVGAAAIAFARQHLGDKPVSGFIFTHSHLDHFGGVLGVISAADAAARAVPVIAPGGFMEEATSENILVGLAMGRRSAFQFGRDLPRSAKGLVDAGLGRSVSYGTFGVLEPTQLVTQPTQEITVDGVRLVFHNVPGAEAPAELTFEVPERKAYCGAEIMAQTIHNLLPVRGAKVRDARRWSNYLDDALTHAREADVYFAQHNWPIWGRERIAEFIAKQRDVYRYTHDQAVRLINAGYTANEIAQRVQLPKSLASYFATRGYYGDLRHNVKAVYQFYLGFYDGNPAHLDPLPPEEAAARYIKLAGGADAVVAAAREAFGRGEYRWTAELLNHVMFDTPDRRDAADLLAQTYEQLGFMAEASTWRNSYLTAAQELRNGPPKGAVSRASMLDVITQAPVESFLDAMAANLDGPAADGVSLKVNLVFSDTQQSWVLWLENAVLHHRAAPPAADANATLTLTKPFFLQMMIGNAGAKEMLMSDNLQVSGSRLDLARFFSLFDRPTGVFAIVTK
jgi:alkyl sulfatase BDS1-like metallo-beta-lactamase superfamily hydrolase